MQSDISMSASPADRTPGATPGRTPNGAPTKKIKPRKKADPLVQRKDKKKPSFEQPPRINGLSHLHPNTSAHLQRPPQKPPNPPARPTSAANPQQNNLNATSLFSAHTSTQVHDFPLILTKRAIKEGFRSHVARFASRREIDIMDEKDFTPPIRLHRRDARALTRSSLVDKNLDPEEAKRVEAETKARLEREEKRKIDDTLVAPSFGGNRARGANLKKTEQVYRTEKTEEQKAKDKIKYEEALPWHIEDFDGNTWLGSYEDALSNTWAMIQRTPDGTFRATPLEKWYKFSEKAKFAVFDADEAEQLIKKKVKEPRWYMNAKEQQEKREREGIEAKEGRAPPRLYVGKRNAEAGVANPVIKSEVADADDLDYVEDRFADDEDNMLFEEDEDAKETEERIKRDQLKANVFDLKAEKEYEVAEAQEKKEKQAQKSFGKNLKKALKKREKNFDYASDSSNPYTNPEDSDSVSTETERRKAEEEKQKANPDNTANKDNKPTPKTSPEKQPPLKSKASAATSKPTSGRATPNNRPIKRNSSAQPLPRVASTSNLKRPGSPLASDASDNESTRSRKKAKKSKTVTGAVPTLATLPARPDSPPIATNAAQAGVAIGAGGKRRAGSGSDTEAGSGGERKRQKLRLKVGSKSPDGSPKGSRAGSPAPEGGAFSSSLSVTPHPIAFPAFLYSYLGLRWSEARLIFPSQHPLPTPPTQPSPPHPTSAPRSPQTGSASKIYSSCYLGTVKAKIGMWRSNVC